MAIRRMGFVCWITKATDTHTEYEILVIAYQQQQWLHERATVLCYTYIACLVITETDCVYCSVGTDSLLGALTKLLIAIISFFMSVRLPAWNNSAAIARIYVKSYVLVFFSKVC